MTQNQNPHSPSLELISQRPTSERRRVPRFNVTTEQFRLDSTGKVFSVVDLSTEGMSIRLLEAQDAHAYPAGTLVPGTLNLKGEKLKLRARVRHVARENVGLHFESKSDELTAKLKQFLDPESLGRELKPSPSHEGGPLWYHGPSGTDILFWRRSDGEYFRMSIFVLGTFIQWDENLGLSTGVSELSLDSKIPTDNRGFMRFDTMLLKPDSEPVAQKLDIAKELVMSSNFPENLKKWCRRHLDIRKA